MSSSLGSLGIIRKVCTDRGADIGVVKTPRDGGMLCSWDATPGISRAGHQSDLKIRPG